MPKKLNSRNPKSMTQRDFSAFYYKAPGVQSMSQMVSMRVTCNSNYKSGDLQDLTPEVSFKGPSQLNETFKGVMKGRKSADKAGNPKSKEGGSVSSLSIIFNKFKLNVLSRDSNISDNLQDLARMLCKVLCVGTVEIVFANPSVCHIFKETEKK